MMEPLFKSSTMCSASSGSDLRGSSVGDALVKSRDDSGGDDPRGYRPCVGLLLARDDGRIWVGYRHDSSSEFAQMPQGGVHEAESYEEAAAREIEEELGLRPEHYRILGKSHHLHRYDLPLSMRERLWNGQFRGQEQCWFLLLFRGQETDIQIEGHLGAPAEFVSWSWVWPKEALETVVPFKRDVYRTIFEEFLPILAQTLGTST